MKKTLTQSLFDTALNKDEIQYRLDLLKYLDTSFYEENEYLFFNMLEYTRFIKEKDSIAYTDRNRLIYLNAPTEKLGNELWKWNFVYAHECLHQIYDTFGIGDQIVKELGRDKYDHYLLNIASDCVINETLAKRYKKKMPDNLITAKYLKQKYDVNYSINEDTQYSMYLKLLEKKDKYQEMLKDLILSSNVDIHDKTEIDGGQGDQGDPTDQEGNPSDQPGNGQGDPTDQKGQEGESKQKNKNISNEEFGEYKELIDYYDSEPEQSLDELINKEKNTLTGPLGEFISNLKKIPDQIRKTKYGINLSATKGNKTDYIKDLFDKTRIILSNKLQSLQKKYKATYTRVNRRNPYNDSGIIMKGKKINNDKLDINLSFYVDISGSMGSDVVKQIFQNLYSNSKPIQDTYTKTYKDILNSVLFNYYAFNESISPVTNNRIPTSNGGNVPLDVLLTYMKKHTETSLINVIITDAGFDIDNTKIINAVKDLEGYIIIITNDVSSWPGYKTIDKQSNNKILAIYSPVF